MSSPSDFAKIEQSPASINAGSEPQTPGDVVLTAAIAQISLNDEQSVNIVTTESGSYAIDNNSSTKGYSPSTVRGDRYTPPHLRAKNDEFVLNGGINKDGEVFDSPSRRQAGSITPSGGKNSRHADIASLPSWRSSPGSSTNGDDESIDLSVDLSSSLPTARTLSFVRADEAQGVYPPSCCVFVANLLQTEGEETLQMAVTQVFREFGPVFVKIRRDAKQMPFAFCQYTRPEHAERAIKEGRGRLIKGRPCRCEKAKAHRLFFVERKFGPVCTPTEVRSLLQPYGNIEFCYTASHVERTALNLGEGVIVQFQLYDDGQNAQSAFRNDDLWKLVAIAGMNSPARGCINHSIRTSPSATDSARAYLSRYESDRRSIFVGNLPLGATEGQIKELFESYGEIEDILLRESASKFEPHERLSFAFVQFKTVMAVSDILSAQAGFHLGGKVLRISQKDSENGGPKRPARTYAPASTAPAATQSAAHGPAQQPLSPMSMAPPAYGSPYAYPYGSPYYYPPGSVYSDGQHYYHPPTYSTYYSYPGSPAYDNTASSPAPIAGSPTSYYGYGYPGYQYSPQAYWGMTGPTAAPSASPASYPPYYSPPVVSSTVPEDRSATPTPTGHGAATTEDTLESQ